MTDKGEQEKKLPKKFENSKLCPMAATAEYLKYRAEYNVAHTNFCLPL